MFKGGVKKSMFAFVVVLSLFVTACGGSNKSGGSPGTSGDNGSGSGSGSGGGSEPSTGSEYMNVEGPLDAAQGPLSDQVFGQLVGAAAGTPMEGVLLCFDQLLVKDTLDVLDTILNQADPAAFDDPQTAFTGAAEEVQASLTEFAADLQATMTSLASGGDCSGTATPGAGTGENPLAGTPLEPLGAALAPVLAAGSGGGDIDSAASFVAALSSAYNDGLATIAAQDPTGQVLESPVLGGLLQTLKVALEDMTVTVAAAEASDAGAATVAASDTLANLLKNVTLRVVPVLFIEEQSGQGPVVSAQIESAIDQFAGAFSGGLPGAGDGGSDPTAIFADAAEQFFAAFAGTPLEPILAQLTAGLAGDGGSGGGAGPTGTPLDAVLEPVLSLLETLAAAGSGGDSTGPTGTPLDIILGPLAAAAGGGSGGGESSCPLAGTPLEPLCAVTDAVTSAAG